MNSLFFFLLFHFVVQFIYISLYNNLVDSRYHESLRAFALDSFYIFATISTSTSVMSFFSLSKHVHIRHPHTHTHHSSVLYIIYKKSTIDKRRVLRGEDNKNESEKINWTGEEKKKNKKKFVVLMVVEWNKSTVEWAKDEPAGRPHLTHQEVVRQEKSKRNE